jgi:hypothetical protein
MSANIVIKPQLGQMIWTDASGTPQTITLIGTTLNEIIVQGDTAGNLVIFQDNNTSSGTLIPGTTGLYLGSSANRWAFYGGVSDIGGTLTLSNAGGSNGAQLHFNSTTTPTSLSNGDMWWDGTALNFRAAGATVNLISTSGSGANTDVAYWNGTNTLTGSSTFTYNGTQIGLSTSGATGGIVVASDTQFYRNGANQWRTPDALIVDGQLLIGTTSSSGQIAFNGTTSSFFVVTATDSTTTSGNPNLSSFTYILNPPSTSSVATRSFTFSEQVPTGNTQNFTGQNSAIWTENRLAGTGILSNFIGLSAVNIWSPSSSAIMTATKLTGILVDIFSANPSTLTAGSTLNTAVGIEIEQGSISSQGANLTFTNNVSLLLTPLSLGINNTYISIGSNNPPSGSYGIYFGATGVANGINWGGSTAAIYASSTTALQATGSFTISNGLTVTAGGANVVSGNVGIGTGTALSLLDVRGAQTIVGQFGGSSAPTATAPLSTSGLEIQFGANSLITLGNGNPLDDPAITLYRTSSGARSGIAWRHIGLTSGNYAIQVGTNTTYGSETYTTLHSFSNTGAITHAGALTVSAGGSAITGTSSFSGGKLTLAAPTTSYATLNLPSGTSPTSPAAGDLWYDGTNLNFRLASTTVTLNTGTVGGSGATNDIAFWSSSSALSGSSNFTWTTGTNSFAIVGNTTYTPFATTDVALKLTGIASQTGDYMDVVDSAANRVFTISANNRFGFRTSVPDNALSISGEVDVDRILRPVVSVVNVGGGSGTSYSYRVSAITATAEGNAADSVIIGNAASLSGTQYNTVSWSPVEGAEGYKIYGRTLNLEKFLAAVGPTVFTYNDTGAATPTYSPQGFSSTGFVDTPYLRLNYGGLGTSQNLLLYSADFTTSQWVRTNFATFTSGFADPQVGTLAFTTTLATATTGTISNSNTLVASTLYTLSCWMRIVNNTAGTYTSQSITFGPSSTLNTTLTINNSWHKYIYTFVTPSSSPPTTGFYLSLVNGTASTVTLALAFPQLELGQGTTVYTPTLGNNFATRYSQASLISIQVGPVPVATMQNGATGIISGFINRAGSAGIARLVLGNADSTAANAGTAISFVSNNSHSAFTGEIDLLLDPTYGTPSTYMSFKTYKGVGGASGLTEHLRIDSNGYIGVNVSSLTGVFEVATSSFFTPSTVSLPASSNTVTGNSTKFTALFLVGDQITITGDSFGARTITAIASDTSLTVSGTQLGTGLVAVAYTTSNSGTRFRVDPSGVVRHYGPEVTTYTGNTGVGAVNNVRSETNIWAPTVTTTADWFASQKAVSFGPTTSSGAFQVGGDSVYMLVNGSAVTTAAVHGLVSNYHQTTASSITTLATGLRVYQGGSAASTSFSGTITAYNGVRIERTYTSGTVTNSTGVFIDQVGNLGSGATNASAIFMVSDGTAATGLVWGTSASAPYTADTSLYRSATATLSSPGSLIIGTNLGVGVATPGQRVDIGYGNLRFTVLTPPGAPTVALGAAGVLTGAYFYKVTFVTAVGETSLGTASASISPSAQQVNLTAIPTDPLGIATARNIYRTLAGGVAWFLLATLSNNTATTYTDNTADGSLGTNDCTLLDNTTGAQIYVGTNPSGFLGNTNASLGIHSLQALTSGSKNSSFGAVALQAATTGSGNVAVGYATLQSLTTGLDNTVLGYGAGASANSNNNVLLGCDAGRDVTSGASNTMVGMFSGYAPNNSTANATTTGTQNTFIGYQSGAATTTQISNSIALGVFAIATGSNQAVIGGTGGAAVKVGINNNNPSTAQLSITTDAVSTIGILVNGITSQTADLQDWQVNGTNVLALSYQGKLTFGNDSSATIIRSGTGILTMGGSLVLAGPNLTVGSITSLYSTQYIASSLTDTSTSSGVAHMAMQLVLNPASSSSANYYGISSQPRIFPANAQNFTGTITAAATALLHGGTGVLGQFISLNVGGATFSSTGTVTTALGLVVGNQGNALIGTSTAIQVANQTGSTTANYGLYFNGTGTTNGINWGASTLIYSSGTGAIQITGSLTTSSGITVTTGGLTISAGGLNVTGTTTLGTLSGVLKATAGVVAGSAALADLSNVVFTSLTSGQYLQYNGTNWVNASVTAGGSIGGAITGGTDTDVLFINSGNLAQDSTFTFNYTNKTLSLTGTVSSVPNLIVNVAGITNSSSPGIQVSNNTATTSGSTVQWSPARDFIGHAWNTTATAADNTVRLREELQTFSGTAPSGLLVWKSSVDTGTASYSTSMTLSTSGLLALPGNITASSTTTGTLVVTGGAGFSGTLYAQNLNVPGTVTFGSPLNVANGGTGAATFTVNGALYGNGTSALQVTAASAAAGAILQTTTSGGAPTYATTLGGVYTFSGSSITVSNTINLNGIEVGNYTAPAGTASPSHGAASTDTWNPTVTTTSDWFGELQQTNFAPTVNTGTFQVGGQAAYMVLNHGTGITVNAVHGLVSSHNQTGAGTTTLATGLRVTQVAGALSGATTTYAGVRIENALTGASGITNAYGVQIDQIGIRGTNGAAIFINSDGTAKTGITWAPATLTGAGDTVLYRSGVASLSLTGSLTTSGALTVSSGGLNVTGTVTLGSLSGILKASAGVVAGSAALADLSNVTITSPTTGQVLEYNGTIWVNGTATATAAPGGSNTQVQFNDSGALNGNANFTYNKTTNVVNVAGTVNATTVQENGVEIQSLMIAYAIALG